MGQLTYGDLLAWLGLSNWQFILLSIFLLLIWVGLRTLWQVGGVGRVRVARKLVPGFQAVFISYEGSYSSIGAVYSQAVEDFQMVFKFSSYFAIYYPPERAVIGVAINKVEQGKIPLFLSKFPMYKRASLPGSDVMAAECPMINSASSQLAVVRVYPAIEQRLKEMHIERESEAIMEMYHFEAARPFIDVIFPIQNQRSFQIWYPPSDYSRVFPPKIQFQLGSMTSESNYTVRDIASMVSQGKKVVVLFGGVYDLTNYIGKHPGGKTVIEQQLGKDATEPFVAAGHLTKTRVVQLLAKFRIGKHIPDAKL